MTDKTLEQIEQEAREQKIKAEMVADSQAKKKAELEQRFNIRGLAGDDLFRLLSILGHLEIKDEFIEMYMKNIAERYEQRRQALADLTADHESKQPSKTDKLAIELKRLAQQEETEARGVEIMGMLLDKVMRNIGKVKHELNEFLGSLVGLTGEEVGKLPLTEYVYLLTALIKSEDFSTFFKSTASLLG